MTVTVLCFPLTPYANKQNTLLRCYKHRKGFRRTELKLQSEYHYYVHFKKNNHYKIKVILNSTQVLHIGPNLNKYTCVNCMVILLKQLFSKQNLNTISGEHILEIYSFIVKYFISIVNQKNNIPIYLYLKPHFLFPA